VEAYVADHKFLRVPESTSTNRIVVGHMSVRTGYLMAMVTLRILVV
jgi:hypothetical protein